MPGEPKSLAEFLGVRPQVWAGLIATAVVLTATYRLGDLENTQDSPIQNEPAPQPPARPVHKPTAASLPPTISGMRFTSAEGSFIANERRENEPVTVLINELFSPDPETRFAAAAILSRRSVYASEAVPVLRKLVREETDPSVKKAMKEALINIRGYVAPTMEFSIKKN